MFKKKTNNEKSLKFWKTINYLISSRTNNEILVGDPWTDSIKDLSASLILK